MLLPLYSGLNANLFPNFVKLIGYFALSVNVVSSNPFVGLSSRIKISLFLLS